MRKNEENLKGLLRKQYLVISVVISVILGIVIPEIIEYINLNYINPPKNFQDGINIKIDGLVYALLFRTLIWSFIIYCGLLFFGYVYSLFKESKNKFK